MTIIGVPYHLDEYLPDLDLPLQPDQVVTAGLPAGDPWERMAVLQSAVAGTVAGDVASGVLSGRAVRRLQYLGRGHGRTPARRRRPGHRLVRRARRRADA